MEYVHGVDMNTCIIVCIICAFHLACADEKLDTILDNDVLEMSDREMMKFLITRVSRLEADRFTQDKRIDDQDKRIYDLEETVLKQSKVIKSLRKTNEENETAAAMDNSSHKAPLHERMKQEKAAKLVHQIHIAGRTRRQVATRPVAFSALLTNSIDHLGARQDIAFEKINVNTNNVYNPNHGVFTVPLSHDRCVYVITATILANQNREVWGEIAVNGAAVANIYARGTDNRLDQGTQTILFHLKQGDDVAIRNIAADDSVFGGLYTTFSGFLLFDEESVSIIG